MVDKYTAKTAISIARLQNVTFQTANAATLDEALRLIVSAILEEVGADACSIYLVHEKTTLILAATHGLNQEAVYQLKIPFSSGLAGKIVNNADPINIPDAHDDTDFLECPGIGEDHLHGFMGVPILFQGKALGVIIVQRSAKKIFSQSDVAFTQTLSIQIASWLALARMREALAPEQTGAVAPQEYVEGLAGSPGISKGTAVAVFSSEDTHSTTDERVVSAERELSKLHDAIRWVSREFRELATKTDLGLGEAERVIFEAYASITESDEIISASTKKIQLGKSAINAVRTTIVSYASQFRALNDDYMRERASDVEHIGRRIVSRLINQENVVVEYPKKTILVGEHLSVWDLVAVPKNRLKGIISGEGSTHSHLAILAKGMGIPAVLGLSEIFPPAELHHRELIVDGYTGKVYVNPSEECKAEFSRAISQESQFTKELTKLKDLPAVTTDGFVLSLMANAGISADISQANRIGADGIGLFRTEFPFLSSDYFLTEEEQYLLYKKTLAETFPKPVIIRTLDIGGDKPLPYWPIEEDNPFLGWRGIRITLDHPEIFLAQIKALIRANKDFGNLRILLPMVTSIDDIRQAKVLIKKAYEELSTHGATFRTVPLGILIEVPSILYILDFVASLVDFFSIGSNDLTQYLLAVDRNNPRVDRWYSYYNPAVVRALYELIRAIKTYDKPLSLCGDLGGDPRMVMLLIGMGLDTLSVVSGDLSRVKLLTRNVSKTRCRELLEKCLTLTSAAEIKNLLEQEIRHIDLEKLIGINGNQTTISNQNGVGV